MLIIVNPYATTVSDRLRHLVVYALQGRFEVDAVDTEARGHATELCREAAHEGYDVVVAFGGDGTVNEAANGCCSAPPRRSAACRAARRTCSRKMLGIPGDARRRDRAPARDGRRLAPAQGRPRRRQRPLLHLRLGSRPRRERRRARRRQPAPEGAPRALLLHVGRRQHLRCAATCAAPAAPGGRRPARQTLEGVTAIVQNGSPFTYFQNRPIEIAEGAALDSGALAGGVLHRATPAVDALDRLARLLAPRAASPRHRQVSPLRRPAPS